MGSQTSHGSLTPDRVAAFRADGFTSIDRISSPAEIDRLREIYDAVIDEPGPLRIQYQGDGVITQVFAPDMRHPELRGTEYVTNGMRLSAELLDVDESDITFRGIMFIYKPPRAGLPAPWHQDEAYWDDRNELRCESLSIWMPLDDVTVESGCMQFIPGSQTGDVLEHLKPEGLLPLRLADEGAVDTAAAVAQPIPAGGATFHHCRTLHYTGPNVSDRPRRAMTSIFDGPATRRDVRLEKPWLSKGVI